MSTQPRAIVLFADGFEEVEAVTPVDFLRRAGIETHMVGVTDRDVIGSRGIRMTTDYTLDELEGAVEAVILPGGMSGAQNLAASGEVAELLQGQFAAGRLVAAICAAPAVVLSAQGYLKGRRFTCFPGLEQKVTDGQFCEDRVVIDDNLITSRGAGTAAEFACEIIRRLSGDEAAGKVHTSTLQKD
ncbi:DJ-1 family glyoxalase III [Spirochaeta africana]|uniref:DJ-1 family protein n=1 Tax=Spirochaeta africana (strain ATCC 700263 / DSM 8902 / Z-7692) TaxID=889378 RepID=H9ULY6_SPIAZ|nr:DJ-1 family glyoxalase III [Spirochaeta africana]AFG38529.1 DJ-1 family protein [Spirochaeta africana DSM 8902]